MQNLIQLLLLGEDLLLGLFYCGTKSFLFFRNFCIFNQRWLLKIFVAY